MTPPNRLLFGSCSSQHYTQTLWPSIISRNATAFVWAGDSIYADDVVKTSLFQKEKVVATPELLRKLYDEQREEPGYKVLLKTNITVLGAIDDHDYGENNGDKHYPYRVKSGEEFLRFLKADGTTDLSLMEQRVKAGKGIYGVKVFDFGNRERALLTDEEAKTDADANMTASAYELSEKSVAVFLLDVRSNKDPWKQGFEKYFKDYESEILGEDQWTWFEQSLLNSKATVNIIVSGIQIHAERFFDGNHAEEWSLLPVEQHRFYQAVLKSNVSAPILLSGDVHMAEIMRRDCKRPSRDELPRMLVEVTTSGMTHSWGTSTCARPYLSTICSNRYIQNAIHNGMRFAHNNHAWTDLMDVGKESHEGAKSGVQYAIELNYGEFEFDWENREVISRILGADDPNKPLLSNRWSFDLLSGHTPPTPTGKIQPHHFTIDAKLRERGATDDDYVCINNQGPQSAATTMYGFVSSMSVIVSILLVPILASFILSSRVLKKKSSL